MAFAFENLAAYQNAICVGVLAERIRKSSRGKASRDLLDQFSRAAISISLNLAEGNGRWHVADKKQFFWIARGSAFECIPIIEILLRTQVIDRALHRECYQRLEEVSKTISGLIRAIKAPEH